MQFFVPRDLNMGRQGGHTHGPIKFAPNKQLFDMIRSKFFKISELYCGFFWPSHFDDVTMDVGNDPGGCQHENY